MPNKVQEAGSKRRVGRPRRLTLDAIVDAACEIGIAELEMGLVAEKLGTGVATLYGYVHGREHLLQLVAKRMARRAPIEDVGQSWQTVLRDHAAFAFTLFAADPKLIANISEAAPNVKEDLYARSIITLLRRRGFTAEAAAELYVEVNQIVIGAAVCMARRARHTAPDGAAGWLPQIFGDYRPTLELILGHRAEALEAVAAAEVAPAS